MNLLLMQRGFPLVVILKNDRKKYYRALDRADRGDEEPLVKLIAQGVERSLNLYLKACRGHSVLAEVPEPLNSQWQARWTQGRA